MCQASHLRELFECCGAVIRMDMQEGGQCIIEYGEVSHSRAAVFLSGTPLGDRPLTVTTYTAGAQNLLGGPVTTMTNPRYKDTKEEIPRSKGRRFRMTNKIDYHIDTLSHIADNAITT